MSDAKREELIQRAEAEIAMAEAELKGLEYQMNDPAIQSDPQKSQEIAAAYAAKEEEIEQRYAKWERLTEPEARPEEKGVIMASIQQTLMGFQGQEEIEGVVDSVIYASMMANSRSSASNHRSRTAASRPPSRESRRL